MKSFIKINKSLRKFKVQSIHLPGDKSISIRFLILSSLANGKSTAQNILISEDTISTINCLKKLGIKIKLNKKSCEVFGKGLFGFNYKNNIVLDAGNSGTCARLLTATLIDTNTNIKLIGDNSLSKRDMKRIIIPLKKFGANIRDKKGKLPLIMSKTKNLKPIKYIENLGSAQCKSAVMLAALKTSGTTYLKCKKSRDHSELMFKNVLKLPIKIKKKGNFDYIDILGKKNFKSFNYKIPSDISSASFFIALAILTKNLKFTLKNINTNKTRTGFTDILKAMGVNIKYSNNKIYNGEKISDIIVHRTKKFKAINLNSKFNSSAIDEFLLIFLIAATADGVSTFNNLTELNKKESKRLDWGLKILKLLGVKVIKIKNDGIKIWGKPNLKINKKIIIKDFMKDHRVFMVCVIAALSFGGEWKIYDKDSVKTSFPNFLDIIKKIGGKIN